MDSFLVLIVIFYFLFIIYTANQVTAGVWQPRFLNLMLYNLLGLLLLMGLSTLQFATLPDNVNIPGMPEINQTAAVFAFAVTLVATGLGFGIISSVQLRGRIATVVGVGGKYDPESVIHTTAVILCITLVVGTLTDFVLGGGQTGLAENIESSGVSATQQVFQGVIFILAAFLGIGFAIRRGGAAALERLGLRVPIREDWRAGVSAGLLLFVLAIVYARLWQFIAPSNFAEQTQAAEQLTESLLSFGDVLLFTVSAALAEEILIRGALQPVFGIGLSSGFFVLLHAQYLGTPTMGLLFVVSAVFGLTRQRFSTSAAIIAHFVYNAVPLILNYVLVLTTSPSGGGV